jgi:hypothetical protein
MITTTLGQLVMAQQAFDRLLALKLSVKAAYHLKKLFALVRTEVQHFDEVRTDLIKELGTKREQTVAERVTARSDDPIWEVLPTQPQAFREFHARMADLGTTPVTLAWGPFDLAWLGDHDITAADLDALGPLVCWAETEAVAK